MEESYYRGRRRKAAFAGVINGHKHGKEEQVRKVKGRPSHGSPGLVPSPTRTRILSDLSQASSCQVGPGSPAPQSAVWALSLVTAA